MAERILAKEFKDLKKAPWLHVDLIRDNIFHWQVALIVLNEESACYGGYFKGVMRFPKNYPYSPPDFKFLNPMFHPNVYPDGRLCISILHPPGEDEMSGESAAIRWSPAQRVESVLISILSLLDDANIESPANVDASVMYRDDCKRYATMVSRDLEKSKQDIPADLVMPTTDAFATKKEEAVRFEDDDWADSDDGCFDFGSEEEEEVGEEEEEDEEVQAGQDVE